MTLTLTRKQTYGAEIKSIDEAQGIVTAYVNTLGVIDHDDEILAPGAFDESIAKGGQAVCWFHDQRVILGGVTSAREENGRLLAVMQFDLDDPVALAAFGKIKKGFIREWSVGFYCLSERWDTPDGRDRPIRVIEKVEWVEVSAVLRGASPGTMTVDAKTAPEGALAEQPAGVVYRDLKAPVTITLSFDEDGDQAEVEAFVSRFDAWLKEQEADDESEHNHRSAGDGPAPATSHDRGDAAGTDHLAEAAQAEALMRMRRYGLVLLGLDV